MRLTPRARTVKPLVIGISMMAFGLTACSSGTTSSPTTAPPPSPTTAVPTVTVPATTQRIYLATAQACSKPDGAVFIPMKVEGPGGYSVTIDPVQGCKELRVFNSYVYDVPMPEAGVVKVTPGNQPTAELDAKEVTATKGTTIFYGREGEGRYKVTTIEPGKDSEVAGAL